MKNSNSKNGAPISVRSKIMWHTGDSAQGNHSELKWKYALYRTRSLMHNFSNIDLSNCVIVGDRLPVIEGVSIPSAK